MIRSMLKAGPLAALLTIPLLSLVTPAFADEDRWLHVAVDGEDRVRLNLPLSVVTAAMPLIDHVPREQMGAYVPMLFPNLGLAASESTWSVDPTKAAPQPDRARPTPVQRWGST